MKGGLLAPHPARGAPSLLGLRGCLWPDFRCPCHRSNNHIYGQVIDDSKDAVVCAASTIDKEHKLSYGGNIAAAEAVGKRLAERALAKGIDKVFFDRNGKPYHGRIKALADGAREGGLSF